MNKLNKNGYKYTYTAGDPTASNPDSRNPSYAREKSFRCTYRSWSDQEMVKAGKAGDHRIIRLWYYPKRVSFTVNDRIEVDGRTFAVSYVPDVASYSGIDFLDARAI